ncbi:MAG: PQQ-dependent sugar dehydrogenase [Longimicrobiales bacterium]
MDLRKVSRSTLLGFVFLTSYEPWQRPRTYRSELASFRVIRLVDGLQSPWSLAFLNQREFLVTERAGRLRAVRSGRLDPSPIEGVPRVFEDKQGGLFDVVLHPNHGANRLVYLSYALPDSTGASATLSVVRGRLQGNRLETVESVFQARARGQGIHFGGRLAFDSALYLHITVGDRYVQPDCRAGPIFECSSTLATHPAQDLSSHAGKVIRLFEDGRVPADNPFANRAGVRPEIWSYGHRNPQGLVFHPTTGDLWLTEHGPMGGDELNLILAGRNYGWPIVGHGLHYDGTSIHEGIRRDGLEDSSFHWDSTFGPSGLVVYNGEPFPHWRGHLFVGGLVSQRLVRIALHGRSPVATEVIVSNLGRIRDVRQGPDGYIYVVTDPRDDTLGAIYRIEPLAH